MDGVEDEICMPPVGWMHARDGCPQRGAFEVHGSDSGLEERASRLGICDEGRAGARSPTRGDDAIVRADPQGDLHCSPIFVGR